MSHILTDNRDIKDTPIDQTTIRCKAIKINYVKREEISFYRLFLLAGSNYYYSFLQNSQFISDVMGKITTMKELLYIIPNLLLCGSG